MNYSKFQERSPFNRKSKYMNSFKWKKNMIKTVIGMKFNKRFSKFFCSSHNNDNDNYDSSNSVNDEDPDEETKDLKEKTFQKNFDESNFISLPLAYLNNTDFEGDALAIAKNKSYSHFEIQTGSSSKKKKNFFFPQEQMKSFFNGDDLNDFSEHHFSSSSSSEKQKENNNTEYIEQSKQEAINQL